MALNIYRTPRKILSILPCASIPGGCDEHQLGRNQPCLEEGHKAEHVNLKTNLLKLIPKPTSATQSRTPYLLSLPVELLQEISTYLSDSEFAAFGLTCKPLLSTLGTKPWHDLRAQNREDFLNLLILLQRDLPEWRLCRKCNKLHGPKFSTVTLPRAVLTRNSIAAPLIRDTAIYILEPLVPWLKRPRRPLYWITHEHIRLAIAHQIQGSAFGICMSTLSCSGKKTYGTVTPRVRKMEFAYDVQPVITRRNFLWSAAHEISFEFYPDTEKQASQETAVKEVLQCVDLRCCIHCSAGNMTEEILCWMFHKPSDEYSNCVRKVPTHVEQGCGAHTHSCDCAMEYQIVSTTPYGFMVVIWQLLGDKAMDRVFGQRGILRNLYEETKLGLFY
ncbi:hypothetical protein AOQ84DRAFT_356856 [Glonium stellatum]|uniref:F-box domain-containing protein n=1 Tax=Glonium stellatum TaxID=574774 RepID=A0A8E2ERV7_9PEZI|nr:hypothetical protein AOQ84DRAFT_356856 [Glonium stellatum]